MPIKRIVSFLPSATELLYEFGVEDLLYGVTHECKYPENAKTKPRVISAIINSDELSSKEIDTKICQLLNEGKKITESLKKRIEYVKNFKPKTKLKVLAIEWIEPFFTAGHWIPEMIKEVGGENMISKIGEYSRKLSIAEITRSDPDIIIVMPCGFDTFRTISEYDKILKDDKSWNMLRAVKNKKVFAVDANSYFSNPSIRTITGLEILAKIIQPENFLRLNVPENSFLQIK